MSRDGAERGSSLSSETLPALLARRRLLARKGYCFEVIDTTDGASSVTLKQLARSAYRETVPYIFVDQRPIGAFADIKALDRSGDLERLVRGEI